MYNQPLKGQRTKMKITKTQLKKIIREELGATKMGGDGIRQAVDHDPATFRALSDLVDAGLRDQLASRESVEDVADVILDWLKKQETIKSLATEIHNNFGMYLGQGDPEWTAQEALKWFATRS